MTKLVNQSAGRLDDDDGGWLRQVEEWLRHVEAGWFRAAR
eukprot:CAMPEP_0172533030 /NCGR_PEP_ID=MMETSP1067-20121228/5870_1 /TAXON_ID=265564 ORGANISM="Thalassiosira punctigera, Strain Tpunct2005C2" /NCGR_SAMPLE_ID=MMETSP1067 /ASSEMBLY_ACC=CAM_ASM_000444 /LENGTH=39 /DNA_ID= /DNA_START= /DNA_END= /DNA_ORIENTATION=